MAETGNLFTRISLRFSMLNKQHVQLLKRLDKESREDKKSKNQIIMDALSSYFGTKDLARDSDAADSDLDKSTKAYLSKMFEETKQDVKKDLKVEIIQELFGMIFSNSMGNVSRQQLQPRVVREDDVSEIQQSSGDNSYNIEEDDVIMNNVQKWS